MQKAVFLAQKAPKTAQKTGKNRLYCLLVS
jgi:hypothetical protein